MKTIDLRQFQSIGLLCLILFILLLLNGCSGTEIPNGVSDEGDKVAGTEDSGQENTDGTQGPASIIGRVSRTDAVAHQPLYVIDKDSKVIGRVETDLTGGFVLSADVLGTQWDEKIYPLMIVVPTSPALMTGVPFPVASTSQTIYVNPVTSETLRNTLEDQTDLDHFATLLPETSIIENETGIIIIDSEDQPVSTPALNITSMESFAESFNNNGNLLVNAAFGEDTLLSETGNSNFDFFWGTDAVIQSVGRKGQTPSRQVSIIEDGQAPHLIDILMHGLEALGDIETVLQDTLKSPESSGQLLGNDNDTSTAFLNQIAAHAVWKSETIDVFTPITDQAVGDVLDETYSTISNVTAIYDSQFLNGESGDVETNISPDEEVCISLSSQSASIDSGTITATQVSEPTEAEAQRIFTQAIAEVLTIAQQTNATAFQGNSHAFEHTLTMGAEALTSEVNRVFASGEISTIFLQPFIDTLTPSVGVSIASIATLGSANFSISLSIQDNITSAARNVGVYMHNAILRIDSKTASTDAEKQALAFQTSASMQQVLQGKDISNQNSGISAADKQQMYCEILNSL